ncbi:glycoside hydrolase family 3 N-terminal domain-containing protein [Spongiactinospora sp. TRM90649]|uniref:glycoside hydrolase family 3 protein n=1 Tax=Spongiactinospora sp. TRM90649 TaxID=3031114 RepID=UPI0023FA469B|nr:glycoside hydrolase family 3 N-terminal domain-containing protein [Spongiactinospora sp. TRM90649]MDF5752039.1 glycoside hydrolase family 3 N-terminal domain-containing protein [Spongiactinospora sp. TRM90649]
MHHSPDLSRLAMAVLQPGFDGTKPPAWLRRALADGLGGAVLFARNIADEAQTADLVAALRAENPSVVVAVDEEGGTVTRMEARTGSSWPGNRALGVGGDTGRTELVARQIGRMLAAAGITLDYAPVADVNADPANPVIGVRSFGPEAGPVADHTAAWIRGLQSTGVAACAKHFPGHGDTVTDSHHGLPTVRASLDLLRERDLPPFAAAIRAGVRAVMCGHLLVPALDPDQPATLSHRVLTSLLREEMGFEGMLVTDAIEMRAVAALHSPGEIAVRALAAGADAICAGAPSPAGESVHALRDAIVGAVHAGRLAESRLAKAADRVRALAEWHSAATADTAPPDRELGLAAARAALRVTGSPAALTAPPLVVDLAARMSLAVDPGAPTGLAAALAETLPGTLACTVTAVDPRLPDLPAERPVVLVAHDAARHPWMRELLALAVRRRPDAIVVETGVPGAPSGAAHIATNGVSRATFRAVARRLTTG